MLLLSSAITQPKKSLEQRLSKHKDDNNSSLHNSKRLISFVDSTPPDTAAHIVDVDCNKNQHKINRIKLREQLDIAIRETEQNIIPNSSNNRLKTTQQTSILKRKSPKRKARRRTHQIMMNIMHRRHQPQFFDQSTHLHMWPMKLVQY